MSTIGYSMSKLGPKLLVNVRTTIGTTQYNQHVVIDDQGSEEANKAEARRELRKTLQAIIEALGQS
jgi:hypothetical protein